jgi:hypothetical protein
MRGCSLIVTTSPFNTGRIRRCPVVEVTYPCKLYVTYSSLLQKEVLNGKLHRGVVRNGAAVELRDLAANHNLNHWS